MCSAKNRPKTIVILSPGFPAAETDTACLPAIQQFCRLAAEVYPRLKFIVVAFQYPFRKSRYGWHNVDVYAIGGKNKGSVQRLITWMRVWHRLSVIAKSHEVTGLLSLWLGETALLGKWFARARGLPHFIWLQGQDVRKQNRYVRRLNPRGEDLIAISAFNKQEMQKNHGVASFMIAPNGVNEKIFPPLNTGDRDIDLLSVGSLIALKNYDMFVRAVHTLHREWPHISAVIVGDGPEARELQALAFRLGLQHNLKFAGQLPHHEVLALMNRTKVFLHPSSYEGLSTVVLEALYSGCDVLSALPVAEEKNVHLKICAEEELMPGVVAGFLAEESTRERVTLYSMRDTVRSVIDLFPQAD